MLNSVTWQVGPGKPACSPSLPEGRASGTGQRSGEGLALLVPRAEPKIADKGRSLLLTGWVSTSSMWIGSVRTRCGGMETALRCEDATIVCTAEFPVVSALAAKPGQLRNGTK